MTANYRYRTPNRIEMTATSTNNICCLACCCCLPGGRPSKGNSAS